jgi:hypothetical protein
MESRSIILTIFVCLATLLSGCASIFSEPGTDDSTFTSQSAPASGPADREAVDLSSPDYHRNQIAHAIQKRDIVAGMSAQEVVSAWGRPRDIEVAGDGSRGNERWIYYPGNSLRYGMAQSSVIYFENGRVAGWQASH